MKRTINGKTYNTETATHIGNHSNAYPRDFNYYNEDLYVTKKGAYFLVGEGGPNSKYSRSCGQNCWTGGDGLQVLTKTEALQWCERHGLQDEIEKFFGDMIEEG